MPETNLAKFTKLLSELFMLDRADLDFGIYRIMNSKREEITRFLDLLGGSSISSEVRRRLVADYLANKPLAIHASQLIRS